MLRLWGASEGELPDGCQWHLAFGVLRLRSELLTSDHTHSPGSHTSLGINEKDTHTFALFATLWPQSWWKPYARWIRCGWNDANKSRKPYSSVWVSFISLQPYFCKQHLLKNGSMCSFNFSFTRLWPIVEHEIFSVQMFWNKVATSTFNILWSLKKMFLDRQYNVLKVEHERHGMECF